MKRTKESTTKADAILMADPHIREEVPLCRKDNFWEAQWNKWDFICGLQKEHSCPVICGGDVFDHYRVSPIVLAFAIAHLPEKFKSVVGQHDLPYHNFRLLGRSSVQVLINAGVMELLKGVGILNWGMDYQREKDRSTTEYDNCRLKIGGRKVMVAHRLVYDDKEQSEPFPGAKGSKGTSTARSMLRAFYTYDLILTGDNHNPFVTEYKGRLLVNPGSLMRDNIGQKDHEPRVYLYYANSNQVEKVVVPHVENVMDEKKEKEASEKKENTQAFIHRMQEEDTFGRVISFRTNVYRALEEKKPPKSIKTIILKSLEKDGGGKIHDKEQE